MPETTLPQQTARQRNWAPWIALLLAVAGRLYSDERRIELNLNCNLVGMTNIKQRRLTQIEVL